MELDPTYTAGETNLIFIITAIVIGIAVIFGIYKIATAHLNERHSLKPSTSTTSSGGLKTTLAVIISIIVFVAVFIAFHNFILK